MPYIATNPQDNDAIRTDVTGTTAHECRTAKFSILNAAAADADGVHAARTCPAVNVAATCVVKASTAATDILTTSAPASLGASANVLSILLTTAAEDTLAVTKNTPDTDGIINIALAKTTASKNTATLIQAAIRTLTSVKGVSVAAFTCAAGGNWDTAAVATGETAAVVFASGVTAAADVLTTGITNPAVPRNASATAGGTEGDIGAIAVTAYGTRDGKAISETLPAFTVNTAGIVYGAKAFDTFTSFSIPAHDGLGATTAIGWGNSFGIPYMLEADEQVFIKLFNKSADSGTVTPDADELEKNVFAVNGTPDGAKDIDLYIVV